MTEQLRIKRDELAKSHSEVYTDNDFRIRAQKSTDKLKEFENEV